LEVFSNFWLDLWFNLNAPNDLIHQISTVLDVSQVFSDFVLVPTDETSLAVEPTLVRCADGYCFSHRLLVNLISDYEGLSNFDVFYFYPANIITFQFIVPND
jgi:hypothetical protein